MSQPKSGLLRGIIVGLLAMLACAAAIAAALLFQDRLPRVVTEGMHWYIGLALAGGLIVGLAMRIVRPRSLLLPPLAAIYGGAAVAVGFITGLAPSLVPIRMNSRESGPRLDPDDFMNGLPYAVALFTDPVKLSWRVWLPVALSALLGCTLVALKVRRNRAAARATAPEEAEPVEEPEYRAPFEPAQSPGAAPRTTGDLFTPRDPGQG